MTQAVPSPAVETEQEIFEQHGIEPVGVDHRYGVPFSQFRIWFGADAVVSSLFVGALGPVLFGLNFWSSLTAIVVGTVVASLAIGKAGVRRSADFLRPSETCPLPYRGSGSDSSTLALP